MSTRSLVGVLDADGRTFRARYCHNNGYPSYQLLALGEALHDHHDGDLARLAAKLLKHDWSYLAASEAAEVEDVNDTRISHRRVQPIAGVGFYYTDHQNPEPSPGTVDEDVDGMIEWLYLAAEDQIRVYYATGGAWAHFGDYSVIDLRDLDSAELRAREARA